MRIQNVHPALAQKTAQLQPCRQIAPAAKGQGSDVAALLPGLAVELTPGVAGQKQAMAPPSHDQSFYQDAALLAAPPQG